MCIRAKSFQSCPTLCDPMNCSHQTPLSMEFSRQEYWGGLPCPSPGDLPNPGIKPGSFMSSALMGGFFTTSTPWKPNVILLLHRIVEISMENSQEYLHIKYFLKLLNSPKDTVMFLNLYVKNSVEKYFISISVSDIQPYKYKSTVD